MNVLCFGDSNTYGYDPRSLLGGRYPKESRWVDILAQKAGWEIINQGENGRCIPDEPCSFPMNTDLVILMLGTNDLIKTGSSPGKAAWKMERFLSRPVLSGHQIMLIAPPPVVIYDEWAEELCGPDKIIDDFAVLAAHYQALAKQRGFRFADAGKWQVELAFDGVHFTEQGHRTFAEKLYEELTR